MQREVVSVVWMILRFCLCIDVMVYTVSDFSFLGSKINVDGDCSHKVKKCLLLGKQAMTNLDCIKKQRHHFTNKGLFCQCYDFPNSHVWL